MANKTNDVDTEKTHQHLLLLREQYGRLQERCVQLEQKLAKALVSSPNCQNEESFLSSFFNFFCNLYEKEEFSDLTIRLPEGEVRAHRLVLAVRGSFWGVASLADIDVLDWLELDIGVGPPLLKWIYTDSIHLVDHNLALKLIRVASKFKLASLLKRCEEALIGWVNVRNCIQLYTTAEEIGASSLKNHCSTLISTYWNDFTPDDFSHMTAPLLYEMFKSKTDYILHAAVRLQREDVLFLFLVEYDPQLPDILNAGDSSGRLALDVALESKHSGIANTLLSHGASVNAVSGSGNTLLHSAVERGDEYAVAFLLENDVDVNVTNDALNRLPLHIIASSDYSNEAIERSMIKMAQEMLILGADPNVQDLHKKTPLHLAIEKGKEALFEALIKAQNIKVDLRDGDDLPPLWYALCRFATAKEESFAATLISKGASVDSKIRENGDTLLHLLAKNGLEKAGIFLTSHDASASLVNSDGENVLHISCQKGLPSLTDALLKAGADPNRQTYPPSPESPESANPFGDANPVLYRETPLHIAIRNSNTDDVSAILNHIAYSESPEGNHLLAPDLNMMDSDGLAPLGVALLEGKDDVALRILKHGANVDQLDPEGHSLLHRTILQLRPEMALFLLSSGANPNLRTREGLSPLELCIENNLHIVVESLCENGAGLSSSNPLCSSPLWLALEQNNTAIADILVRYNTDVDCWEDGPEGCKQTLLHRAIDENREDIACFLIENGCSVNAVRQEGASGMGVDIAKENLTPLHMCCSWGLLLTARTLIMFGAKINGKDADGKSPFHLALENSHFDLISLLLEQSSLDLSVRDMDGKTPFAAAMSMKNNKAAQAILHKHPAAAEQFDHKGFNFLHTAVQKGDLESVLFLLSIHVNLTSRTKDERQLSPLHLATLQGSEMVVRNLLLAGARINEVTPQKQTCLHLASKCDHSSLCIIFIDNGINVDALDDNLNNALHVAVKEGHLTAVRTLLTGGSRINAGEVNLRGQNALHVLASYPKDNSAAIFNIFMEALPNYPINETDVDGNSVLLLAYVRGAAQLCRCLVRAGACLGACNKQGVHLFNYQVATKSLLCRLLDSVQTEPPWSEGEFCLECATKFGIATRRHHCRHCGRVLCSKCSAKDLPIMKFGINKPVRVCQMCFDILTIGVNAYS